MRRLLTCLFLAFPLAASAESGPLFMKHLLDGREFFEPWGIGIDFLTMDQGYDIKSLEFDLPGVSIPDPTQLDVDNEVRSVSLKGDVWLTPFLNVFALLGQVNADTFVDLSSVPVVGLPIRLGKLPVSYDGTVYGGGLTLIYGGEHWFTSVTGSWTDTSLSGDFDSSVETLTAQPRIGLVKGGWSAWVGGFYVDTEEKHSGTVQLPVLGGVPFSVELEGSDKWSTAVGAAYAFGTRGMMSLEAGFGGREHVLASYSYRF